MAEDDIKMVFYSQSDLVQLTKQQGILQGIKINVIQAHIAANSLCIYIISLKMLSDL